MGSVKYRFHCIPSLGRRRGVLVGVRKPKEVSGEDVAQGQTARHQDVGRKVRCKIVQDQLGGARTGNVGAARKVLPDSFF